LALAVSKVLGALLLAFLKIIFFLLGTDLADFQPLFVQLKEICYPIGEKDF
jgi:hypothetical protein